MFGKFNCLRMVIKCVLTNLMSLCSGGEFLGLYTMDNDKYMGSDSDSSFVFVSDNNSVGSDSENYVILGDESYVATASVENLCDVTKQQLKIVDTDISVGTDSEEDLSDESKQQLKNVDKDSYMDTDSEGYLYDESEPGMKNVNNDCYLGSDYEEDIFDESEPQMKNVDNDSYLGTDSEEYLSDGSGEVLKIEDNGNYVGTVVPVPRSRIKRYSFKFHTYSYKRIGHIDDCPEDRKHIKKMNINDAAMEYVLPFLPAKILCRLKTVSKQWDQWIGSAFFSHKQTYYFRDISGLFCQPSGDYPSFISLDRDAYGVPSSSLTFLPKPVTVRTTCKGLLCCQTCDGEDTYYICNPLNKQWKELPKPGYYHGPESFLALAFEPSVLDFEAKFELVCAFSVPGHTGVYFDIFSSRSNSWELSDAVCYELNALELSGNGLFLKGVVFWETSTGHILAFDLKEKQYGMMLLPLGSGPQGVMTEMNGELCYILPCEDDDGQYTLEIYGDMCMNLKRRIHLIGEVFNHVTEGLRALACVNDDVVVILLGRYLIAYHVKAGEIETLRTGRTNAGYERFLPYVNSLVAI